MLLAEIDFNTARQLRALNANNHVLNDRRPQVYAQVLQPPLA